MITVCITLLYIQNLEIDNVLELFLQVSKAIIEYITNIYKQNGL